MNDERINASGAVIYVDERSHRPLYYIEGGHIKWANIGDAIAEYFEKESAM